MDSQQMLKTVRLMFDEVYTKGSLKVCDEILASNLKFHDLSEPNTKPGLAAFKESESQYIKAFPNKKAKIEDIFVSDNKVVVRWSCKGKQEGEMKGIPATNRTFQIAGIGIYAFKDEKISEIWESWDHLTLLEQLGVIHTPAMH